MTKIPPKTYLLVFLGLMALLALTAGAARFDLGAGNTIVAIGVAVAKALLILLYFMHLRFSSVVTRFAALAGLFWLGLLFGLSLNDYLTRGALGIAGK